MNLSTIANRGRPTRDDKIVGPYQDEPTVPLWYVRAKAFWGDHRNLWVAVGPVRRASKY